MTNEIIMVTKPKSSAAENIRTLRTNLQFTFINDDVKSVMITSSVPAEGKSFLSANLSCAFALVNTKVLLIDCDMRRGRQKKLFDLKSEIGLSNLLLDDVKNYKKYIQKTDVDNLYVLPSGIAPPNPSELLGSEKNKELFKILKKEYDLIILDCPPINAVTDTLVLSQLADEAVLVCKYKKTPMDLLISSKKALENTKIKFAGVVMNGIESSRNKYYYGKYYK